MAEHFVRVASVSELAAGRMKCIQVQGRRILLVNVGGTFHAADGLCTHEEAPLCNGSLKEHYVKCPLHGSRFDLHTGEPMEEPADVPLTIYPVRIDGDDVFVRLS